MSVAKNDTRKELAAAAEAVRGGECPPEAASDLLVKVERLIEEGRAGEEDASFWHDYLDCTRRSPFLLALPDDDHRLRWAETMVPAMEASGYSLETMLHQRLRDHPDRTLFQEMVDGEPRRWSYARAARRIRSYAAALLSREETPRVAIIAENSVVGACADLACLIHDIFVTPLDPEMSSETVAWVFDKLSINVALVDNAERRGRVEGLRPGPNGPVRVFTLDDDAEAGEEEGPLLDHAAQQLGAERIDAILRGRKRFGLRDRATAMFTSGSTGMPKGVVFTPLNLISKRFARAAALPRVGEGEVLFCYLPLHHTFGRYLEMMGMLFWGGTYVLAGNPSFETLLAGLRDVRPTGLISIPRRWMQIRDHAEASAPEGAVTDEAFRAATGGRLRWGLSAAGYLDPKVFHFFHRMGVDLCSGFGMTEGTGGITMTPPGDYEDNTVGIPLPLVRMRLSDEGELQVSGPYIAEYLDPPEEGEEGWLKTGDIFHRRESGNLEIVDRIKDIYKNSKGQTVAPRRVEQKFAEVPGVRNSFLVGDGRSYNVLLIVPDREDPVLRVFPEEERQREYFHRIITAANEDLAPYERVVNFALLDRDFSAEHGELTPKGSFRRKAIEKNFAEVVEELYRRDFVELSLEGRKIRIPRWFYRDLGILETDIVAAGGSLINREDGKALDIAGHSDPGVVRIGDFEYEITGGAIDLGLFAGQPALWIGNPALIDFCPCREGWDVAVTGVSSRILLPWRTSGDGADGRPLPVPAAGDHRVRQVNRLCATALFGETGRAVAAIERLEEVLDDADLRLGNVIRRRLEMLARHPEMEVRRTAYRVLLLDRPVPDYGSQHYAFVLSGLPFLDEKSIHEIATADLGRRRLEALRMRLHTYRDGLDWPAGEATRGQFEKLFALLADFARYHPEYYGTVRAEMVNWILHRVDPELAQAAELELERLAEWFEKEMAAKAPPGDPRLWEDRIVLQDGIAEEEINQLEEVLIGTTFLHESVMLAFDGDRFRIEEIPPKGIWISRIFSFHGHRLYRVSINTMDKKHYDLLVRLRPELERASVHEMNFWTIAIHGFPHGAPVVPRFGCYRPDLGAMSLSFVSDLTVWERIREREEAPGAGSLGDVWHNLFIRGMAIFFRGWRCSGRRIVPGTVTPRNVAVPEPDYREGEKILSLEGWKKYRSPIDLVKPMLRNFYQQIEHHVPRMTGNLDRTWIYEACIEGLGAEEGDALLTELRGMIDADELGVETGRLRAGLDAYLEKVKREYHVPIPLRSAVARYDEWAKMNPEATSAAREQIVRELARLYRLGRFGFLARYHLYRHTCFSTAAPSVLGAYDRLLQRMFRCPEERPTHMVELSDLQAELTDPDDRRIFGRLVFPQAREAAPVEVVAIGESDRKQVIVRTQLRDGRGEEYTVRDPIEPAEIGHFIRLIITGGFPNIVSEQDRYFVAIDSHERIVGGTLYKLQEPTVAHLDGIVVAGALKGRGLSSALLEDFCSRMQSQGVKVITTHFFARHFYQARGFHVDKGWGGLVRFLEG